MFAKTLIFVLPVCAVVYASLRLRYAWSYEMARDDARRLAKDMMRYARMTAAELVQKRLEEVREELKHARASVALLEEGACATSWSPDLFCDDSMTDGCALALASARQDVARLEKQEARIIEFKSRAKDFQADFLARLRQEVKDVENRQASVRSIARKLGSRRARNLDPVVFGS